jgi:hypothetical protein
MAMKELTREIVINTLTVIMILIIGAAFLFFAALKSKMTPAEVTKAVQKQGYSNTLIIKETGPFNSDWKCDFNLHQYKIHTINTNAEAVEIYACSDFHESVTIVTTAE